VWWVSSRNGEGAGIVSAHGDGGAATQRFLADEILPRFSNPALDRLEDGAAVAVGGMDLIVSTDTFTVTPAEFPGGDIGRLAVTGTVNDVLAAGGRAAYLTFGLVLSEGFPMATLRRILDSAKAAAEAAGVRIVAGDTKVIGRGGGPEIFINTAGIGTPIHQGRRYEVASARPGDRVLVTGTVGDHGLAVLSAREGLGFERRVVSDCAALHELVGPLLARFPGIRALRDPTRGGLVGALLDIAERSKVELVLEEEAVPVADEVRFGCEMLGLSPLTLVNEGKMVLVVDPAEADATLAELRRHPLGAASAIIGQARRGSRVTWLVARTRAGERIVVRPEGDPLPRLC
jgi:hydrogenase expression/formation protein HypE